MKISLYPEDEKNDEIKRSFLEIMSDVLAVVQTSTTILRHEFETAYYRADLTLSNGRTNELTIKRR
jgi:hypothetical protein